MPTQFLFHNPDSELNLTKVYLKSSSTDCAIYVNLEKFENHFYCNILDLYSRLYSSDHSNMILTSKEIQEFNIRNLSVLARGNVLNLIDCVDEKNIFIKNDLFNIVNHINSNAEILAHINPYISHIDSIIRYITICLDIIDNDGKSFSEKYVKGINYSFSRLISDLTLLHKANDYISILINDEVEEEILKGEVNPSEIYIKIDDELNDDLNKPCYSPI